MQSMKALEEVHPKLINDPKAMRHCSEAMHSAYLRRQARTRTRTCTRTHTRTRTRTRAVEEAGA